MGRVVYTQDEFIIEEERFRDKGFILINSRGQYENHGHIKKLNTCKMLIRLMQDEIVPDSDYLRGTVLRVSLNEKYKTKVRNRVKKEKNRVWYHNPNKGIRRK